MAEERRKTTSVPSWRRGVLIISPHDSRLSGASGTLEQQPTVWPVPYACAQPYHPGSAPCLGADQKARGLCERDWAVAAKDSITRPKPLSMTTTAGWYSVHMRKVLARPWVGVRMCHLLKWVPVNLTLGGTLRWIGVPSRGNKNTSSRFMLQKPG